MSVPTEGPWDHGLYVLRNGTAESAYATNGMLRPTSVKAALDLMKGRADQAYDTINGLSATATTGAPGTAATVTISGPMGAKVINIKVPRGNDGAPGMGYAEGLELTAAAQSAQADAARSAEDVELALQAQFLTQDEGVAALVGTSAGPKTKAALADNFAARTILPATRARAWGHSFMAGVGPGVGGATQGMARLMSDELLLPLSNKAVGGATLYNRVSAAAHWGIVLREETRGHAFVPQGGFYPVMYGLNDINHLGQTYASQATFRMALRTVISRLRAAAVFENDHESVTLGGAGTWATTAPGSGDARAYSGTSMAYNATPGATISITTPADFPGGTIALGFTAWTGGGATITGAVNGSTYSVNTAATSRADSFTPAVLRVPNVPAGAGSYVFTTSSVVGSIGAIFDYWQWEPPEQTAPLVALVGQPKPLDYTGYGAGGTGGPPTDAGVDALNLGQQDLAAEFGYRVVYVDTSGIDKDPAYWVAGNVHPKAAGHAYIAAQVSAQVKARVSFAAIDLSRAGAAAASGGSDPVPDEWATFTPVLTGAGTAIGNGVWQFARYLRQGDTVHFMARFLLGSTTTIGSVVEVSLPTAMLSAASAVSLESECTDAGVGTFSIRPKAAASADKVVLWYAPGSGVWQTVKTVTPMTWTANDSFDIRGTYLAWPA